MSARLRDEFALGIDIGGTFTKLAVMGEDQSVLAFGRVPTEVEAGPELLVGRVASALGALCGEQVLETKNARAAGVAIAGLVQANSGILVAAPNLRGWPGFAAARAFSSALGCPAVVENDASVFALGEAMLGAGRGHDPLVLLTLGTGVGGGLVMGGRIVHGRDGFAGEFGHMALTAEGGPLCACGARGCLEAYLKSSYVVSLARDRANQASGAGNSSGPSPALSTALKSGEATARTVGEAAQAGDPVALAVFSELGHSLGIAIANLISAFNPDAVIVGGGVALAGDVLLDAARSTALARVMPPLAKDVTILAAQLGDRGGVLGACLLGLDYRASTIAS